MAIIRKQLDGGDEPRFEWRDAPLDAERQTPEDGGGAVLTLGELQITLSRSELALIALLSVKSPFTIITVPQIGAGDS